MTPNTRKNTRARLARIEGQVRGLTKMIDEDRYCIDIITQVRATRAALLRIERLVLQDHLSHCIADAVESDNKKDREQKIDELITVINSAT
jgi:CsoR family transcriptional regulator, copper-sensing transcriptional repressor